MGNGAFVWKGHGHFVEQRNQRLHFLGDARSCCIHSRYPWILAYRPAFDRIWEIRRGALYCGNIYVGVPDPSLPGLPFDIEVLDESLEANLYEGLDESPASTLLDSLSDSDLDVDETIREVEETIRDMQDTSPDMDLEDHMDSIINLAPYSITIPDDATMGMISCAGVCS